MDIYVGNISTHLEEDDLRELFEPFGSVLSTRLIKSREFGQHKGFGFVKMHSAIDAARAIDDLNGRTYGGRNLVVHVAKSRSEQLGSSNEDGGYRPRRNYNNPDQDFNRSNYRDYNQGNYDYNREGYNDYNQSNGQDHYQNYNQDYNSRRNYRDYNQESQDYRKNQEFNRNEYNQAYRNYDSGERINHYTQAKRTQEDEFVKVKFDREEPPQEEDIPLKVIDEASFEKETTEDGFIKISFN